MIIMKEGDGNRRTKEREVRKKWRDGEAKGKKKTQTWTPNTCALARTTEDHNRMLVPRSNV